jgi:hypothetical protein
MVPQTESSSLIKGAVVRSNSRLGLRIDHLWIIAVLASFGMIVSLMPLFPNDFWWHIKIGQIISQTGTIPSTNLFSWSLPTDTPFTYGAWLGGYLLYLLFDLGGVSLVIFARNLLALAAFGLVGFEAYRRSGSWRIAAVTLALACAMSSNNTVIRPQIWAWLPFVITYLLLSRYTDKKLDKKWLLAIPLMMVFWVNVHGSYVLGIVLIGITIAGETLRRLFKQDSALSWIQIGQLAGIGVLSLAAILVNPQNVHIFGYVKNMMTDKPSQTLIMEWQSPSPSGYASIAFFASLLVLIAVFAYSRYKPTPTEMLLIAGFVWLAWSGVRYIAWFGLVAVPILAASVSEMVRDKPWMAVPPKNVLNLALALVLIVPLILLQPWLVARIPMPEAYAKWVLPEAKEGPLLSIDTPIGAVEHLRRNPGGNLFNEMAYGSYLIWAVPEQKVFVDPRVELYPYEQWLDYIRVARGGRYNEILDKYGADRILLNRQEQEELVVLLEEDQFWEKEYEDIYSQIWRKKN